MVNATLGGTWESLRIIEVEENNNNNNNNNSEENIAPEGIASQSSTGHGGFEVEVLNQDGVFELMGIVPASVGNHSNYLNYSFMDHSPRVGENTYRIKVVLKDEIFIYLDPQAVSLNEKIDIKGFPNPTDGQLF